MIEQVLDAMKLAAEVAILPRFRMLRDDEVEEKSPGEIVTRADRESEQIISEVLRGLRPDAVLVAEEAAAANPSILRELLTADAVWLLDPLDGTANFVRGQDDFAVMVALVQRMETTHAWIWRPQTAESWVAVKGAGAERNGSPVRVSASGRQSGHLRGAVLTRFLTPEHRLTISESSAALGELLPGKVCAGVEYPDVICGNEDFALFRRTLPWDHAPGAFILQEAGGVARRWSGASYSPAVESEGLLAATDEATWHQAAQVLLPSR